MSDKATIFEPMVNHNLAGGFHRKFIDYRPGDNGL
jgi:hypothetical protein